MTKDEHIRETIALQKRVEAAIEGSPKGLTNQEVCHALLSAAISQGVLLGFKRV